MRSANHKVPHYAVRCYLIPLRPKYLHHFLNTLCLCSSISVRVQFSPPYKTTGKIIILYILILIFLDSKLEDKRIYAEWWQLLPEFSEVIISS